MKRTPHYESDDVAFPDDAYTVKGYRGVAWRAYGWETQPTEATEWDGLEARTGKVVCVMVGDDRRFVFDAEEIAPLDDLAYCASCGQVGCTHDGRDRT